MGERPKWVRELELRALRAEAEVKAWEDGIREIEMYLQLPKFAHPNDHVHVSDLFLRFGEVRHGALVAMTYAEVGFRLGRAEREVEQMKRTEV